MFKKNVITTISAIIFLSVAPPVSGFGCKESYAPHSSALNIVAMQLATAHDMNATANACATANYLRVGIWFMEKCNRSSLSQTEKRQLDLQIKSFRVALRDAISTYNHVNAGSAPCKCQREISNYCMD